MRRALATLLLGLLPLAFTLAAARLLAPAAGEPLPLRWARAVADHPLRSAVAFALLALGAGGRPRSVRTGRRTRPSPGGAPDSE